MAEPKFIRDNGCKEAVCVDAGRVYDSCCEGYPSRCRETRRGAAAPPSGFSLTNNRFYVNLKTDKMIRRRVV